MPAYECDGCGACCEGHLLVEADLLDLLREPRLLEADRHRSGVGPLKKPLRTSKSRVGVCSSSEMFVDARFSMPRSGVRSTPLGPTTVSACRPATNSVSKPVRQQGSPVRQKRLN